MKKNIMLGFFCFLFFVNLVSADVESVVTIVAGKSPCKAGPTNCMSMVLSGKVLIEDFQGTKTTTVKMNQSGLVKIKLKPGAYRFKINLPNSETLEQDVVSGDNNLVFLRLDTGIR